MGSLDVDPDDLGRGLDDGRARPRCCSVTADDGHPSQLPRSRSRTAPAAVVDVEQLDVAAVRRRGTAAPGQRALDPDLERVGVQPVHEQQARDEVVGDETLEHAPGRPCRTISTIRSSPAP